MKNCGSGYLNDFVFSQWGLFEDCFLPCRSIGRSKLWSWEGDDISVSSCFGVLGKCSMAPGQRPLFRPAGFSFVVQVEAP